MLDWKCCRLALNDTLRHALKIISDGAIQMGVVTDKDDKLIGIVTDGDIRRRLLQGVTLETEIASIVNYHPLTEKYGTDKQKLLNVLRQKKIQGMPLIDDTKTVIDVITINDFIFQGRRNNLVVLMAGGLGVRLRPLTESCPKPLLKVGKKPILETIINSFKEHGFYRFYLAVNYKSHMIEEYFGDGSKFGVEINYLHEKERMGTAGSLFLLPEEVKDPLIVMNGDLLTKVDFGEMLDNHVAKKAEATMAVREYHYHIPYGVIDFDGSLIHGIKEKPEDDYYVNAGIYVLSPTAVRRVDEGKYLDMPDLFKKIIDDNGKVNGYLIQDYWLDIGRMDDFARAQEEYSSIFGV